MFVENVELIDFRNYQYGFASFSPEINIIYGKNAAGKTNILEALYFTSTARSHRQAGNCEMIRFCQERARINASFSINDRQYKSEITLFPNKKKQIKINKVPVEKASDLMGYLKTVLFCPEDLSLIKGVPKDRRRMLDVGICRMRQKYFHALAEYTKVLRQKSNLLKKNPDSETLWVWNEKLAESGSEVMWHRKLYIDKIAAFAKDVVKDISGESFEMEYSAGASVNDYSDKKSVQIQLLEDIKRCTPREKIMGIALAGPHRDDFKIKINGSDARCFASQGQQRTAAVALKIAELEIVKEVTGENPVLLLDDVLSELDGRRQQYIINRISGVQVIITCTDADKFSLMGGANKINVESVKKHVRSLG